MTGDEINQLPKLDWMPSRIPKRNGLVAFVPDDSSGCPQAIELAMRKAPARWYPQPGGHRVVILYEGGTFDSSVLRVETDAWDHEDCDVCGERIPPMTLCHVTKRGDYIALCESCYEKYVCKPSHNAKQNRCTRTAATRLEVGRIGQSDSGFAASARLRRRSVSFGVGLRMSRFGKFVVIVSVIWCIGSTIFFSHRTSLSQLLTLPLFLCFLVAGVISIVCIFSDWRQRRWYALVPLASCVLAVVVSGLVVRPIRHGIFTKSLPSYEAVVQQMESGRILVSTNLGRIPQAESQARLVYAVLAQRDANGVLTVEFLTEGGFPVKHSGYLYCSSGVVEPGSDAYSRWPIRHEEKPKWFYISD